MDKPTVRADILIYPESLAAIEVGLLSDGDYVIRLGNATIFLQDGREGWRAFMDRLEDAWRERDAIEYPEDAAKDLEGLEQVAVAEGGSYGGTE